MTMQEVREKYPQYNDLSDEQLAEGLHKKFYADLPYEEFAGKIGLNATPPPPAPAPDTLASRLRKRAENIRQEQPTVQNLGNLRQPLRVTGQLMGAAGDIMSTGVEKAYNYLMPASGKEIVKEGIKYWTDKPAVQKGVGLLTGIWKGFEEQHPEEAKDIRAATNILTMIPAAKGTPAISKEAGLLKEDLTHLAPKKTIAALDKKIDTTIKQGVYKSIRPSVAGKQTYTQVETSLNKSADAVKNIISNKNNLILTDEAGEKVTGALPKNLIQFSEALDQTKKSIFDQYDSLAKQAGDKGITVDLNKVADKLEGIGWEKVTSDLKPKVASYADGLAETLRNRKVYTATEAQDAIATLNNDLKNFYKNPTYENSSQAYVDSVLARELRDSLDKAITGATGEQYSALKKAYGSLKSLERDVNRRAIVDARKNTKGLIDFTDIYTSGWIIDGILTGNMATVASGITAKGLKAWMKAKNDPNRIVKNLFKDTEDLVRQRERASMPYTPQSRTAKILGNKRGEVDLSKLITRYVDNMRAGIDERTGFTEEELKLLADTANKNAKTAIDTLVERDRQKGILGNGVLPPNYKWR